MQLAGSRQKISAAVRISCKGLVGIGWGPGERELVGRGQRMRLYKVGSIKARNKKL